MRLTHIIDYLGYVRGGAESQLIGLCKHSSSLYDLTILTTKTPFTKPDFDDVEDLVTTVLGLYHVRELSFLVSGVLSDILFWGPARVFNIGLRKHIEKTDLIHCHSLFVIKMLRQRKVSIPIVLTIYNPVPERHKQDVAFADIVLVQSKTLFDEVIQAIPQLSSKLFYIPPGVSVPNFLENRQHFSDGNGDLCKLLFIGRFRRFKNLETLLNATVILSKSGFRFSLTIIATGVQKRHMQKLIRELGVESLVNICPTVSFSDICSLYNAHDIVVAPSWYESFSLVSLEALLLNKKLLVSKTMTEFLNFFPETPSCDPSDPMDIAAKVIKLSKSSALNLEESRFLVFQWTQVVKKHAEVYALAAKNNNLKTDHIPISGNSPDHKQYFDRTI
ncbi:MAG: glycosyltransferase family 4 protein [Ardenticatenaceae bacterium]|nr:glycosyltransferase family 4 protein [Ardenticatenaceae bacterium]